MKILIMGLPGSGKTTLAKHLVNSLGCIWFNADDIREKYNDWDFSPEGRIRQAKRIHKLSSYIGSTVVCDFVAPTEEIRDIYSADILVWMDTIEKSCYEDTNIIFEPPQRYDVRVTEKDAEKWSKIIFNCVKEKMSARENNV